MQMTGQELQERIAREVDADPDNTMQGRLRYYDHPLIGVAPAADPLFVQMKEADIAGDLFRLPQEWLPGAASVVVYYLPFSREVRSSNYAGGKASMEWLHARFLGEAFSNKLREMLIGLMEARGEKALAPMLEESMVIDYQRLSSNWSERHAAYAAGLGTFSLNRGMITAKGMAGRFGSVITTLELESTPRIYEDPFQNCPWMVDGSCGECMDRCPSGAITEKGKDKRTCYEYLFIQDPLRKEREPFGYSYSACGKCQTAVPCEARIP